MGIWVGRYAMVEGQVQEHGPWLIDQRREHDDGAIRLLILAEPVDRQSAEFCGEVAEAVAALFGREALSVTGGLLRALRQAHLNLAEWNERSLREHQVAVGLTCVAIRDGEATIAQVGAGLVYVIEGDDSRRLSTEDLPGVAPLGGTDPIEPLFTTAQLETQHLLLVSSAAERRVGEEALRDSLTAGPERALAELFTRTREVPDMSAVLIADLDIEQDTPPLSEPETLPEEFPAPTLDSGSLEAQPAAGWPERRSAPSMPAVRRPSRVSASTTTSRFAPPRPETPRWAWAAGGVAGLVVLVLLGWLLLPGLFERDGANRLEDALAGAQLQVEAAERAESPDVERLALVTALSELERARTVDAEEPRLLALEARILEQLAVLDAIVPVGALQPVLRFAGTVTTPLDPTSITFGGGSLWLIDGAQGRVFRIDPEGSFDPVEVYSAARVYGGTMAAAPLVASWDQDGERLLMLDVDHQLWSLGASGQLGPASLLLRGGEDLRSVTAIATYGGSLYVLDPEGGEIWRYLTAGDGYDSERDGLLGAIELPEATHLVVDGDIYVQDGSTIRRFRQGTEQPSLLVGIDQPPEAPAALVEDVIRGLLFVADRGNGRVIVGDREGLFVRQYRHSGFADIRGLALSGDGETLYVLTTDGIEAFSVVLS
jgi:hypothetical protein